MFATIAHAAHPIEIIQLKNRQAQTIIPMIKPMLSPGAKVSGSKYTLIVKTDPQNFTEIKKIVDALDKPAKTFIITIKRDHEYHNRHEKILGQTDTKGYGNGNQAIRVLEGHEAFIKTGEEVPFQGLATNSLTGNNAVYTQYKDVTTGFYVKPRMVGHGQVLIKLRQQRMRLNRNGRQRVLSQSTDTTVTAPIGQWVQIGGISQRSSRSRETNVVYRTRDKNDSNMGIWLKIELVN